MTYILHLETATKACSVALSGNGKLIAVKEELNEEYSHSEKLTVFISEILKENNIGFKQLSAISVASGPGSYTGLRIGVSTAKGLCYALSIPLIAVDSLLSLATIAANTYKEKKLCAMIDARRMEVFSAIYDHNLNLVKPISADIIDAETYKEYEPFVYFGDGADKIKDLWSARNCKIDSGINSSAIGQVALAFEKYNANELEDLAYFEPFYLKDFIGLKKF